VIDQQAGAFMFNFKKKQIDTV